MVSVEAKFSFILLIFFYFHFSGLYQGPPWKKKQGTCVHITHRGLIRCIVVVSYPPTSTSPCLTVLHSHMLPVLWG
ncbi:hypothetical protein F5Y09DRAFT_313493 [Xylaria sp. FL1042]|nr:hypothetical protein F5Y09DRAFT_313493 [Xylaria sp. FL1042]